MRTSIIGVSCFAGRRITSTIGMIFCARKERDMTEYPRIEGEQTEDREQKTTTPAR